MQDAVRQEVLLARVPFPALPAHERRVAGVRLLVAAQVRGRHESLVTHVAVVRPLPGVAPQVGHQVVLGAESPATDVARVRPLARVRHLVARDGAPVVARVGAVAAEELALTRPVRLPVPVEVVRGEEVVALLTAEAVTLGGARRSICLCQERQEKESVVLSISLLRPLANTA